MSSPELSEAVEDEQGGASKLPWLVRTPKNVAWALVVFGGVGLLASFFLTVEYIHKLQAPTEALVCDLSLFVTCGPAMQSSAGAIRHFLQKVLASSINRGIYYVTQSRAPLLSNHMHERVIEATVSKIAVREGGDG